MIPRTPDTTHPELVSGDWIVRFEPRRLEDVRTIVGPSLDNERRFATVRRVSEIGLGVYRTFLQPFVKATVNDDSAALLKKFSPNEMLHALFSERNPMMRTVEQLSEQIRAQRHQVAAENPFVQWQSAASKAVINALNGWRDLRDTTVENMFLMTYGSPILQAMVGLHASDEPPRRRPGNEPERTAFVEGRIKHLVAQIAEGSPRDAIIRCLGYIGMGGSGIDERAFNQLIQMRVQHKDISLEEFKCAVRDQYFSLLFDEEAALAAIPSMLPTQVNDRKQLLSDIHRIVDAAGDFDDERVRRLSRIEALFAIDTTDLSIKPALTRDAH